MRTRTKPLWKILALPILLAGASCKGNPWKREMVYSQAPVAVYTERKIENGQPSPQGFAHPQELKPEHLSAVLASLKFTRNGLFKGPTTEPIFTDSEVAALVDPLSRTVSKLGPDERARFLVARTAWRPLFLGPKGTSAVVFFTRSDQMDLAFDLLQETLNDEAGDPERMSFPHDPVEIRGRRSEIDPLPGVHPVEAGPGGKTPSRWVKVHLAEVSSAFDSGQLKTALTSPTPAGSPTAGAGEVDALRRRLNNLETLLQNGAITREEYEKARIEILSQR